MSIFSTRTGRAIARVLISRATRAEREREREREPSNLKNKFSLRTRTLAGFLVVALLSVTPLADVALATDLITATSSDGNTVFGSSGDNSYVYIRSGGTLVPQARFIGPNLLSDYFGWNAAFAADGNTLLVAAYNAAVSATPRAGAVYVYIRSGSVWTSQGTLIAADPATGDQFGITLAVAADGNTAIVGANTKNAKTGAAYVFTRSGGAWTQQQKLTASDGVAEDAFGNAVTLNSTDGNTAIVTAPGQGVTKTGAAYVFTRSGAVWTQQQKLTATAASAKDALGQSATLSADGNTALVGAAGVDTGTVDNTGAGYIFTRSGGVWTQQGQLTVAGAPRGAEYGATTALAADGNTALLGGFQSTASTFTRSGGVWSAGGTYTYPTSTSFNGQSVAGGAAWLLNGTTVNNSNTTCVFDSSSTVGNCNFN